MSGIEIADDFEERVKVLRAQAFTGVFEISANNCREKSYSEISYREKRYREKRELWSLYFVLGRIVWVSSQAHTLRRWRRHLSVYSPTVLERSTLPSKAWNYAALSRLVRLNKLSEKQLSNVVESVVTENLFDIFQALSVASSDQSVRGELQQLTDAVAYSQKSAKLTGTTAVPINQDRAWREAEHEWDEWVRAGLSQYSPKCGLEIVDAEGLRLRTTPQMLRSMKACCDRNHSLRDLALKFRQPVTLFTRSVMPYIEEGLIAFAPIPNLSESFDDGVSDELFVREAVPGTGEKKTTAAENVGAQSNELGETVVYIDDSPLDSRFMARIVRGLKYKYVNISDPILALPSLLEIKPALIFLDLVMPTANGYEVCSQIRRMSAFKQTPIIIVTSNDGVADRIRAKLVGASGFLGKPIRVSKVAKVLATYLQPPTAIKEHQSEKSFEKSVSTKQISQLAPEPIPQQTGQQTGQQTDKQTIRAATAYEPSDAVSTTSNREKLDISSASFTSHSQRWSTLFNFR